MPWSLKCKIPHTCCLVDIDGEGRLLMMAKIGKSIFFFVICIIMGITFLITKSITWPQLVIYIYIYLYIYIYIYIKVEPCMKLFIKSYI